MSSFKKGDQVLRSRYTLIDGPRGANGSDDWVAIDRYESPFLVKLWAYQGDNPDDVQRALWDSELRTLYRVGSSPGADETLLVLRDAGIDRDHHSFVMALEAPGYDTLGGTFAHRARYTWLSNRDANARRELWRLLQRLADGLRLLHEQHVLHRNVTAETAFFNPEQGIASARLGGFEWSMRLGVPAHNQPPPGWSSPPEFFTSTAYGYRPETDWYAFGMLAARCLLSVENYAANPPVERHRRVFKMAETSTDISDVERALLVQLIAVDPRERLSRGFEIEVRIRDIVDRLDQSTEPRAEERPFIVVISPTDSDLLEAAHHSGFEPNPAHPHDAFNPNDLLHVEGLRAFLQGQLQEPQLYAVPNADFFLLVGAQVILRIVPYETFDSDNNAIRTWALARCIGIGELRANDGGTQCTRLPKGQVVVRTKRDVQRDRNARQQARNWERILPKIDKPAQLRASLARFHDFIRCTNQLELLIRDAEIFRYRIVSQTRQEGADRLVLVEMARARPVAPFARMEGGMPAFLNREIESGNRDCRLVGLTSTDEDGLSIGRLDKSQFWEIQDIRGNEVVLTRPMQNAQRSASPEGTLRTFGMFGQIALIKRRKRAIDRLEKHSYLLRSLSAPGQVYMDTGAMSPTAPLAEDKVDAAKRAAIEDILRVRPIYTLQGPPGTGKTTLVAHLLRQILSDDKVAQILITAQAHGAVDVLREKVRHEAFADVPESEQPLAVRLGTFSENPVEQDGSVEHESLRILERARDALASVTMLNSLQSEWLDAVKTMIGALRSWRPDRVAPDFCELVKRGANITYCTTSAGDLEALADMEQSFDWSIIEEAGKAHGFDLALPMQAGHRWLLIGDQNQLPPYRFKDYWDGIEQLEQAVVALQLLPDRGANLVDFDWIRAWQDQSSADRNTFKDYALSWLNTFERIFGYCSNCTGSERVTINEANGAAAGMLSGQHRMHPLIGELISLAYYKGKVQNCTLDEQGAPLPRVVHPFSEPGVVSGRAIVWIDLPWVQREPSCAERGPETRHPRYTNPAEIEALASFIGSLESTAETDPIELALLSPYNQQVTLMNRRLLELRPRLSGLELKRDRRQRRRPGVTEAAEKFAHTVDSFQGNQADVIAVSLVRNNAALPGDGLGFLTEAPRLNVLLSRAERLLILVGSWEFFERQVSLIDPTDTTNPMWHWRKVIDNLRAWFASGRAARVNADPSAWKPRR